MTTQEQMFPMTQLEISEAFLAHFEDEVEKRTKSMISAQDKLADALKLREMAEHEVRREHSKSISQVAADIVNSGALDTEDIQVTASVTPAVDPITGEVASVPVAAWECPDCHGHGRLPDKTGGGHHKCKACDGTGHAEPSCDNCTTSSCNLKQRAGSSTMGCGGSSWLHGEMMGKPNASSVVVVLYPGDDEPHVTIIGDRTRYGELVADYFTAAGLNGKHVAKDWTVVAEDELTTAGGGARKLRDVIAGADYGKRLIVAAADQGSVTGAAAAEESAA